MQKTTDPRERIVDALTELGLDAETTAAIVAQIEDEAGGNRAANGGVGEDASTRMAQRLLRASHKRSELLGNDLVSDPAWHMLLDLHAARAQKKPVTVSSLCAASGSPVTTALRYLDIMTQRGLITRRSDVRDARRVLIEPTPHTIRLMGELIASYTSVA